MSSIVKQKVGDHIYLYESISFRNADGKPRNKRVPIGKIDPQTGLPVYKPDYLERMALDGTPIAISPTDAQFSELDIMRSSIRDFGSFYLFKAIALRSGLTGVLMNSLPHIWKEVFMLATFLVSSGDPFMYCEDWLDSTESFDIGSLSSQRISELLTAISPQERSSFYKNWCKVRSEQEFLALDITSSSSYSTQIGSVEWGYNRDKEKLPQINICMLMGYQSRLPIYQSVYSGSLKDVSTLKTTLDEFAALAGKKPMIAVMDKGFFSTRNVNIMLNPNQDSSFLIAVPFTCAFAKKQIASECKDIDSLENTIVCGNDSFRAVTKQRKWNADYQIYTHIFYNARKALLMREDLYAYVAVLKEHAESNPVKYKKDDEYTKYLTIRHSEKQLIGYTVTIREDVVKKELETAGWLIIISNCIDNAKEAIKIYRDKDIVEKGFLRLKNSLDLGRLRVHNELAMQNKVFIGFISLILLTAVHNTMVDKGLYQKMTLKKLLLTLAKLKVQEIDGKRILFPLTKGQKAIYKAFDIPEPM